MTKIIAIANQKGGVGKTTTAVNLSAALAATKRRVLVIDLDPQGNATTGLGIDKKNLEHSVYDVLTEPDFDIRQAILRSEACQLDVLPGNTDLTAAKNDLLGVDGAQLRLRQQLEKIKGDYHYIIIDCPPTLNMLTVNAMATASGVLVAMQCEYYALEGLADLIENIEAIRDALNPQLTLEGLLRTMYDPRISLTNEVSGQLAEHFGEKLYQTVIPRNIRLAEAPSFGTSVIQYDRQSKGALAYLALAAEMLRRHGALADTKA